MSYIFMAVFAALIVVIDQISKFLVVENIAMYEQVQVLPGLFSLTYVQNPGAAFSMLEGQQWLFAVIFALFTVAIIWELAKKSFGFSKFELFCIAAVYAGGLGNMIDRLRLGYVVDMIKTDFMDFPIFNVADIFITCGCIVLVLHLIFFNKAFWKDGKK